MTIRQSEVSRRRAVSVGLRGGRYVAPHSTAEKLWARTDKTSSVHGCWLVAGVPGNPAGHVQIKRKAEGLPSIYAHRLSWQLLCGPVPDGLKVLHNCPGGDNPRCVNPAHLFLGTQHDNIHDAIHKGRRNAFGRQRLTVADVYQIRALAKLGHTHKSIGLRFGIRRHSVTGVVNRRSWAYLPEQPSQPLPPVPEHTDRVFHLPNGQFDLVPSVMVPVLGEVR